MVLSLRNHLNIGTRNVKQVQQQIWLDVVGSHPVPLGTLNILWEQPAFSSDFFHNIIISSYGASWAFGGNI